MLKRLPRFREAEKSLAFFAERESWTRQQIQAYQLDQINHLWAHASKYVPYYQQISQSFQVPAQFCSLKEFTERMPVLPKKIMRDQPQRFLSQTPAPGGWQRTGGSTGAPTAIYWESEAHRHILRSKYRNEQRHGLGIFDKKVFLWGHSGSFAPGAKGRLQRMWRPIEDRLRNRLRVSAYNLSEDYLLKQLKAIQRFRPRSLYGYSSAIDRLAEVANRHHLQIPELKVAILTAEPADPGMLDRVSQRLHCDAISEYGATECAFMASHETNGTLRTRDDVVFLETLANDADSYDIVITVLGNPSFPLMRYVIEDTTSKPIVRPEQGFGILTDIQGRSNDMLISRTGRRLHAMFVKHTLEHWPEVRRFTAHQDRQGNLNVQLESYGELSDSVLNSLQEKLVEMLDGAEVILEQVDQIRGNLAGKHRWIISELASPNQGSATP